MANPVDTNVYYVDNTLGNDYFSGLSPSTPWKTVSKVNAATFAAGDTILFKRGETWREALALTPPNSGTAASPITFGAYGGGNAKPCISGRAFVSTWSRYTTTATYSAAHASTAALTTQVWDGPHALTYVTWNSDIITTEPTLTANSWTYDDPNNLVYVQLCNSTDAVPVDPNTVSSLHPGLGGVGGCYVTNVASALLVNTKSYLTFKDLDFDGGGSYAVRLYAQTAAMAGMVFQGCDIHNGYRHAVKLDGGASTYTIDLNMVQCRIYDDNPTLEWDPSAGSGVCVDASGGWPGAVVIDGCEFWNVDHGLWIGGATNLIVRNNYIHDNWDDGVYVYTATRPLIYNNIIYHTGDDGIDIQTTTNGIVFNNTIAYCSDAGLDLGTGDSGMQVYGNIFCNNCRAFNETDTGRDVSDTVGTAVFGNNVYWSDRTFTWRKVSTDYTTLATWQTAIGSDTGSVFADPLLADPFNGRFELTKGSPALGKGYVEGRHYASRDFANGDYCGRDAGAIQFVGTGTTSTVVSDYGLWFQKTGLVGQDAVLYLPAAANARHEVLWVGWSYDGTPTGGLVIKIGDIVKLDLDLTQASDRRDYIDFANGLYGYPNQAVEIRLKAGSATVTGKLAAKIR